MSTTTAAVDTAPAAHLLGWDCIELWVGNARAFAGFLMSGFGFRCTAYAGPETGVRDKASYVLEQGDIRFVVSGALTADSPIAAHVRAHGDGVHDLAWLVDERRRGLRRGDRPRRRARRAPRGPRPTTRARWSWPRSRPTARRATPSCRGAATTAGCSSRATAPRTCRPNRVGPPVGLTGIDHVVGNVEQGKLADWVRFYREVIGFGELVHFDDSQIATEYSALMSTVVWDGTAHLHAAQRAGRRSQEEPDPGVPRDLRRARRAAHRAAHRRHRGHRGGAARPRRALHAGARRVLRRRPQRLAGVDLEWDELQRHNILVDRDQDGFLLQIFTETVTDRPTVFFEIIERHGAKGFGEGNFKALFEAIERDQARRGNL